MMAITLPLSRAAPQAHLQAPAVEQTTDSLERYQVLRVVPKTEEHVRRLRQFLSERPTVRQLAYTGAQWLPTSQGRLLAGPPTAWVGWELNSGLSAREGAEKH